MFKPVVIVHLLGGIALALYIHFYFNKVYSEECKELFSCGVDITLSNVSKHHPEVPSLGGLCPLDRCLGDQDCCSLCKRYRPISFREGGNEDPPIALKRTIDVDDPFLKSISLLTIAVCLLITVNSLQYWRKNLLTRPLKVTLGLCIFTAGFSLIIFFTIATAALVMDYSYYVNCHSKFALVLSWSWISILMSIDFWCQLLPKYTVRMRRIKARQDAMTTSSSIGSCAIAVNEAEKIRYKSTGNVFNALFVWISNITILWWPFIFLYFCGLERGSWKFQFPGSG